MKMKRTYKWISENITGLSCPIFGVSWKPPASEREAINRLLIFLEDRRLLHIKDNSVYRHTHHHVHRPEWVAESVIKMRTKITKCLASAKYPEETTKVLRDMQNDCRLFLDEPFSLLPKKKFRKARHMYVDLIDNFRDRFGINISKLCTMYGVDAEGELASLVIKTKNKFEKKDA